LKKGPPCEKGKKRQRLPNRTKNGLPCIKPDQEKVRIAWGERNKKNKAPTTNYSEKKTGERRERNRKSKKRNTPKK